MGGADRIVKASDLRPGMRADEGGEEGLAISVRLDARGVRQIRRALQRFERKARG